MKENIKNLLFNRLKESSLIRSFFRLIVVFVALVIIIPHATLLAQGITVSGFVTDGTTGEPLLGVNIIIQGTTTGAVTDLSGKYTINVPNQESVLVFSFVGYITKSVTVGSQKLISVTLSPEVAAIEEVVVVGYGTQKKESVVGAISQVTSEQIQTGVKGSDMAANLQGSLPGLAVQITTGRPGGRHIGVAAHTEDDDYGYMYIRGVKTWNSTDPLVLVDGVERELYNVNPYEIEKISVLKDASATAVFGVKGANGVILITTSRGKEGRPVLSFDATISGKTLSRYPRRLDSYDANRVKNYTLLNEGVVNPGSFQYLTPGKYLEYYKNHTYPVYLPDVEWQEEMVKDWAYDQNYNLSISGGTKFVKYYGLLSYNHEGDILNVLDVGQGDLPSFDFHRFNFRSNLDFSITPTTQFGVNLAGYFISQSESYADQAAIFYTFYNMPPDQFPVRYPDGTFSAYSGFDRFPNPAYHIAMYGSSISKETQVNTDFMLNQKLDFITSGLSANGKLSYDNMYWTVGPRSTNSGDYTKYIKAEIVDYIKAGMTPAQLDSLENNLGRYATSYGYPQFTIWTLPGTGIGGFDAVRLPDTYTAESATNTSNYRNIYYEMSLNYNRDFGKHSVGALGLMSRQISAKGSVFPSYREDWVGRVTYGFDRRYNLEFNAAYNGSEKFSSKYRFGFFPSMAVGWTISNEPFFESIRNVFSTLKIRYSDGIIGSDAGINRWLYISSWVVRPYSTSMSSEDVGKFGAPYIQNALPLRYEGTVANPDIQWETSHKRDLGFETGFFDNAVRINFDYFYEDRSKIYISGGNRYVPDFLGAAAPPANIGKVKSHGWEFEAQLSKTLENGLNLWFNHAWTYAKNKVIEYGDPLLKPYWQKTAGYPIGQGRYSINQSVHSVMASWNDLYNNVAGLSNTYRLPGDFATIDYNSDGYLDSNDAIPYGYTAVPEYTYAPSFGFTYKGFSGNVRFYGVYNAESEIEIYFSPFPYQAYNVVYPWNTKNNWSPELGVTDQAVERQLRYLTSGSDGYYGTTRAFTKLQHAELSYTLNTKWIKKIGVNNLKLIVSGDNLVLWSAMYEDFDAPQIHTEQHVRTTYPKTKHVNVGIKFDFR